MRYEILIAIVLAAAAVPVASRAEAVAKCEKSDSQPIFSSSQKLENYKVTKRADKNQTEEQFKVAGVEKVAVLNEVCNGITRVISFEMSVPKANYKGWWTAKQLIAKLRELISKIPQNDFTKNVLEDLEKYEPELLKATGDNAMGGTSYFFRDKKLVMQYKPDLIAIATGSGGQHIQIKTYQPPK